jgi:hypothetical protein
LKRNDTFAHLFACLLLLFPEKQGKICNSKGKRAKLKKNEGTRAIGDQNWEVVTNLKLQTQITGLCLLKGLFFCASAFEFLEKLVDG